MHEFKPTGTTVRVRYSCDIDEALEIGSPYGFTAFSLECVVEVYQVPQEANAFEPTFGGWYGRVRSANLSGEGNVGVPADLSDKGAGPCDTPQLAAEKATREQLRHLKQW